MPAPDVEVVDCGNGKVRLERNDGFMAYEEANWLMKHNADLSTLIPRQTPNATRQRQSMYNVPKTHPASARHPFSLSDNNFLPYHVYTKKMDAVGTTVGIASFGIQICQGLLSYYDGWKGYHKDIATMHNNIADLATTFTVLKASLTDPSPDDNSSESRARVEKCLVSCTEGLCRLQKKLLKLRDLAEPQGFRQKTWAEMQRSWYPFRTSTVAKLRELVGVLRDNLSLALQTHQQATLVHGFKRTEDRLLAIQQAERRKSIVDWLSPPDPDYNHNAARARHESGTGAWLLQCGEYKRWHGSANTILWLTGSAGCGKTVLCSTVIEDIRAQCQDASKIQFAYFYFSFSDTQKQSYPGLLSSLITQLLHDQVVLQLVQQAYDKYHPRKPPNEVLERLVTACLQQRRQTVLALDALDELPETGNDGWSTVLEWLGRTMQDNAGVKIFLTSRRLVEIETNILSLGAHCVLLHPDLANSDIRTHVGAEMEKHSRLKTFSATTKEEVIKVFEQKADGSFRWAFCQLEVLKKLKSTRRAHVEEALHNLPSGLDATYERMLLQIGDEYHGQALAAIAALRILTFETRPLTLGELWEASLIDYENNHVEVDDKGRMEDIINILGGLVSVEHQQQPIDYRTVYSVVSGPSVDLTDKLIPAAISEKCLVRLAHFSVKEYLLSGERISNSKAAKFAFNEDDDLPILAQSFLTYVLHYSMSASKTASAQDLDTFPLLRYASQTWPKFISKSVFTPPAHEIQLLQSEEHRHDWLEVYRPDEFEGEHMIKMQFNPNGSSLYYASVLGIIPLCRFFLEQGVDPNVQGGFFDNALQAASSMNHPQVVQMLLDAGADVNAQGVSDYSALLDASSRGHVQVVQLLLDAGADINASGGGYGSPLIAAISTGRLQVVQQLLDAGADINVDRGFYGNALKVAISGGHVQVVQQLLDAGANVNAKRDRYDSPLQIACLGGHLQVVQQLLDAGANVNTKGGWSGSALNAASGWGHLQVVQLLLATGADVNAEHENDGTALQSASSGGHLQVVQQLLDAGADVNAEGGGNGNALQKASIGGHLRVVQQLLGAGADVNAEGGGNGNALQGASSGGHLQVVQQLLNAGADVNAEGCWYGNALQAASHGNHQDVVKLLLAAGVRPDSPPRSVSPTST